MSTETPDPDTCERIFHAALAAGDARGVESTLLVMAPQDPHRAQRLYDILRLALRLARPVQPGTDSTEEEPRDD